MNNLDRFRLYCKHLSSPNLFIEWSFYYLIGAALQRRVWFGELDYTPLFPNLYVVLVADPGIGKTIVLKPTLALLSHWKKSGKQSSAFFDPTEFSRVGKIVGADPSLINIGADATTFEALCRSMSRSIAVFKPSVENAIPYIHSSMTFNLDEFSSLLRKNSESVVEYLLKAFDCGSYKYETVSRGEDFVNNPCLSFIAGTTPDFMKRVYGKDDSLMNGGLAARIIFVFDNKARFRTFIPPKMEECQRQAGKELLDHIKKLTEVYGPIDFGAETMDYMANWWEDEPKTRTNNSPRLKDYYSRKNITVAKLAMILHFADSNSLKVPDGISVMKRAIDILEITEVEMHKALSLGGKNPVAELAKHITEYLLRGGPKNERDIIIEFFGESPDGSKSIKEALEFLVNVAKKLKFNGNKMYEVNLA